MVLYHGGRILQDGSNRIKHQQKPLTQDSPYLNGDVSNAKVVIVTTYQTLVSRHGKTEYSKWRAAKVAGPDNSSDAYKAAQRHAAETYMSDLDHSWPADLSYCFKRVFLDEGHEIRHTETMACETVWWLQAEHVHLLTATPMLNQAADILGLITVLEPSSDPWKDIGVDSSGDTLSERQFDPWTVPKTDPRVILRHTSRSINAHVIKQQDLTQATRGARLRSILQPCMIRRSHNSIVDGKQIGSSLKPVQIINARLEHTLDEQEEFEAVFSGLLPRLYRRRGGRLYWDMSVVRKLSLVTAFTSFRYLRGFKSGEIKGLRAKKRVDNISLLKNIAAGQKARSKDKLSVPDPDDIEKIVELNCAGSPKLRYLLDTIGELVLMDGEKMIVWVNIPVTGFWIETVSELDPLWGAVLIFIFVYEGYENDRH